MLIPMADVPRWLPKPVSMPQIAISGPGGTP